MNKETLLRCKVADQIGLLDSAESKLLKLLTQGNWPKKKWDDHCGLSNTVLFEVHKYHKFPATFATQEQLLFDAENTS